jgi:hypothetical protein
MNGRVYYPLIGKFLSGDPIIQDPTNGQNYNRFSYVLNNPTNLTDPTGFSPLIGGCTWENFCQSTSFVEPKANSGKPKDEDTKSVPTGGATTRSQTKDDSAKTSGSAINGAQLNGPFSQPQPQNDHDVSLPAGQSRPLTQGEVSIGQSVYPDMNMPTVTICRCTAYFFQPSDRAMSPDGNIYFHPLDKGYYDDFSKAPASAQHTFVHEMGHVRQTQKGENVRAAALDRNYVYWPLVPGKEFMQYGLEQRAEMVADYFLLMKFGSMYPSLLNQNPRPTPADYEKVVPYKYRPSGDGNQ